jgi:CrcB protein
MSQFLWICLGGAVGTGARYPLSGWMLTSLGSSFPFGTLAVNVIGSFLIVVLMIAGTEAQVMSPTVRLTLTAGVLGGFTTYSAFSYETLEYLREAAWWTGALNVLANVFGCLAASGLGFATARWLFRA